MAQTRTKTGILLRFVDEAYDHRSWHGPNLKGSLRGITALHAIWRPGRGRHSIWELVLHAAYWKYVVVRRLRRQKRGSFPMRGSNWFARRAVPDENAWKADLRLLEETHRSLRRAVAALDDSARGPRAPGRSVSDLDLVIGVAAHDLYHAGQIQLIKRMHRSRSLR